MGLFAKGKEAPAAPAVEEDDSSEEMHPLMAIAAAIAQTPDPTTTLAMVISLLVRHGVLTAEALESLGLTSDELSDMLRAVDNFEGVEAFNYELQVQAAIRSYDRELELIAVERGIKRDSPAYVELRSTIAGFAADNNVSDLRVAYRLMLAECPERLPQPSA